MGQLEYGIVAFIVICCICIQFAVISVPLRGAFFDRLTDKVGFARPSFFFRSFVRLLGTQTGGAALAFRRRVTVALAVIMMARFTESNKVGMLNDNCICKDIYH